LGTYALAEWPCAGQIAPPTETLPWNRSGGKSHGASGVEKPGSAAWLALGLRLVPVARPAERRAAGRETPLDRPQHGKNTLYFSGQQGVKVGILRENCEKSASGNDRSAAS
jgi:hypothetical protein